MQKKIEHRRNEETVSKAPPRLVKLRLSDAELRQLRIAAAYSDQSHGEFVRAAVMQQVEQVIASQVHLR